MKSYNGLSLCLLAVLFITANGGAISDLTAKAIGSDDILPSEKTTISSEIVTNKTENTISPLKNDAGEATFSTTIADDTTFPKETTTLSTPAAESPKTTTTAPETSTPITTASTPTTTNSTAAPTTTISTTPTPAPTTTTPIPPTSTSTAPSTTTVSPPDPVPCRQFDGPSFIGGIVLSFGVLAIGLVAYKFYKARNERNYHTL